MYNYDDIRLRDLGTEASDECDIKRTQELYQVGMFDLFHHRGLLEKLLHLHCILLDNMRGRTVVSRVVVTGSTNATDYEDERDVLFL